MASCVETVSFHQRHGKKVLLSESGRVAHRAEGDYDAVVFTARPVPVNALFRVELQEVDRAVQRRRLYVNYALVIGTV